MKKIIISLVVLILTVSIAFADVSVYTDIDTTGDVLLDTDVNTTGDVEVWIDGTNINQEITATKSAIKNVAGSLVTLGDLTLLISDAAHWLNTGSGGSVLAREIGFALDTYFASDYDIGIVVNKINELDLRITVLERTMEDIAPVEFCEEKKIVLKEYNLTFVKCGKNTTVYTNVDPEEFKGSDIIGYTANPCFEEWKCSEWSICSVEGIQYRECEDKNVCGTNIDKPLEVRGCIIIEEIVEVVQAQNGKEDGGPTGTFFGIHDRDYVTLGTYVLLSISIILTFLNIKVHFDTKGSKKRRNYKRK